MRQLGFISNGGETWTFAPSGVLLGYLYSTDVRWETCPSGYDAYGDLTCGDWAGAVYATPNTTILCDHGHQDAYVPDVQVSGGD